MNEPRLSNRDPEYPLEAADAEDLVHAGGPLHIPAAENLLFRGVPADIVAEVLERANPIRLRAGDVIFEDASLGQYCYLVESGSIDISKRAEGDGYRTIGVVDPGEFFGELALFYAAPRMARATAATAAELVPIDRHSFEVIRSSAAAALASTLAAAGVRRLEAVHVALLRNLGQAEDREAALALSEITHNLRSPLAAIRSDLRFLIDASSAGTLDASHVATYLAETLRSAEGGLTYANSLLRHLHEELPVLTRISIQRLAQAAVDRTGEATGWIDTRIEMDLQSERIVEGNDSALTAAIGDLLSSALERIDSDDDRIAVCALDREVGVELSIVTRRVEETIAKRRRVEDDSYPAEVIERAREIVERHRGRLACDCQAARDAISIWLPTID